ncbi:hypothetical protein LAUMK35_02450 [Mycobacterium pseudokansasii]|uniref:Uncharacterized protein n=1 Tax=Mycobacterium pseudokansasii TaxID=2341080 RepID=A0A498QSU5_9MYCO|nr:hypothetical protein LAUMK35_02450 [Mycobacterium pseudokansasii]VAZ94858.1 hypothetical protein LAUMK21_02451 [Mycobacterium pseudokansasii]VBA50053.1 hypothetical protein LAUMK142_02341 [Mycobacterium pseudokansasii]
MMATRLTLAFFQDPHTFRAHDPMPDSGRFA